MIKKLFYVAFVALVMTSCGNKECKNESACTDSLPKVSVDSILSYGGNFAGKMVWVSGKVDHICVHTGRRMVLLGSDSTKVLHVMANDTVAPFDTLLVGSMVCVKATVLEEAINEAYINRMVFEADSVYKALKLGDPNQSDQHVKHINELAVEYREKIKATGNDHFNVYSMENGLEVMKCGESCKHAENAYSKCCKHDKK